MPHDGGEFASPEQIVARLSSEDWDAGTHETDAAVDVEAVLGAIALTANSLDSGVLAPAWVERLTPDEVDALFRQFIRDGELASAHEPGDDGRCVVDGESDPCQLQRRLAATYLAPDPE